jgi:hypothetical protein
MPDDNLPPKQPSKQPPKQAPEQPPKQVPDQPPKQEPEQPSNQPNQPAGAPAAAVLLACQKHLFGMVADAQVLATYVSRYNIDCDAREEAVATVIHAQDLLATGLTADEAAAFFAAFGKLARAIHPRTVSSLRDSLDERDDKGEVVKPSRARMACRWWSVAGIVVLIGLVLMHTYWLAGRTLLDMQIVAGSDAAGRAIRPTEAAPGDIAGSAKVDPGASGQAANAAAAGTPAATPAARPPSPLTQRELSDALRTLRESRDAISASDYNLEVAALVEARNQAIVHWTDYFSWMRSLLPEERGAGKPDLRKPEAPIIAAKTKLTILYYDWLPLCYGLLGSMAFLLRSLARSARERLYRSEDTVANFAHLCLGAFAGLSIGWFWKGSGGANAEASSISPFAIAFLAGYSIDLVFSLMDRAVSTVSTRPEQANPTNPVIPTKVSQ